MGFDPATLDSDTLTNNPTTDVATRLTADLVSGPLSLSPQEAAAFVGNFNKETANFSTHQEIMSSDRVERGERGGIGAGHWTGSRRTEFEALADKLGLDVESYEASLAMVERELSGRYADVLKDMRDDPDQSLRNQTDYALQDYEGASTKNSARELNDRTSRAAAALQNYQSIAPALEYDDEMAYREGDQPMGMPKEGLPSNPLAGVPSFAVPGMMAAAERAKEGENEFGYGNPNEVDPATALTYGTDRVAAVSADKVDRGPDLSPPSEQSLQEPPPAGGFSLNREDALKEMLAGIDSFGTVPTYLDYDATSTTPYPQDQAFSTNSYPEDQAFSTTDYPEYQAASTTDYPEYQATSTTTYPDYEAFATGDSQIARDMQSSVENFGTSVNNYGYGNPAEEAPSESHNWGYGNPNEAAPPDMSNNFGYGATGDPQVAHDMQSSIDGFGNSLNNYGYGNPNETDSNYPNEYQATSTTPYPEDQAFSTTNYPDYQAAATGDPQVARDMQSSVENFGQSVNNYGYGNPNETPSNAYGYGNPNELPGNAFGYGNPNETAPAAPASSWGLQDLGIGTFSSPSLRDAPSGLQSIDQRRSDADTFVPQAQLASFAELFRGDEPGYAESAPQPAPNGQFNASQGQSVTSPPKSDDPDLSDLQDRNGLSSLPSEYEPEFGGHLSVQDAQELGPWGGDVWGYGNPFESAPNSHDEFVSNPSQFDGVPTSYAAFNGGPFNVEVEVGPTGSLLPEAREAPDKGVETPPSSTQSPFGNDVNWDADINSPMGGFFGEGTTGASPASTGSTGPTLSSGTSPFGLSGPADFSPSTFSAGNLGAFGATAGIGSSVPGASVSWSDPSSFPAGVQTAAPAADPQTGAPTPPSSSPSPSSPSQPQVGSSTPQVAETEAEVQQFEREMGMTPSGGLFNGAPSLGGLLSGDFDMNYGGGGMSPAVNGGGWTSQAGQASDFGLNYGNFDVGDIGGGTQPVGGQQSVADSFDPQAFGELGADVNTSFAGFSPETFTGDWESGPLSTDSAPAGGPPGGVAALAGMSEAEALGGESGPGAGGQSPGTPVGALAAEGGLAAVMGSSLADAGMMAQAAETAAANGVFAGAGSGMFAGQGGQFGLPSDGGFAGVVGNAVGVDPGPDADGPDGPGSDVGSDPGGGPEGGGVDGGGAAGDGVEGGGTAGDSAGAGGGPGSSGPNGGDGSDGGPSW